MIALCKAHKGCPKCPKPGNTANFFRFYAMEFDVTKVRELMVGDQVGFVTSIQLEQYGIPRQPLPPGAIFSPGRVYLREEHLAHIPARMLGRPIIFATVPYPDSDKARRILIDGEHTAAIKIRRGD